MVRRCGRSSRARDRRRRGSPAAGRAGRRHRAVIVSVRRRARVGAQPVRRRRCCSPPRTCGCSPPRRLAPARPLGALPSALGLVARRCWSPSTTPLALDLGPLELAGWPRWRRRRARLARRRARDRRCGSRCLAACSSVLRGAPPGRRRTAPPERLAHPRPAELRRAGLARRHRVARCGDEATRAPRRSRRVLIVAGRAAARRRGRDAAVAGAGVRALRAASSRASCEDQLDGDRARAAAAVEQRALEPLPDPRRRLAFAARALRPPHRRRATRSGASGSPRSASRTSSSRAPARRDLRKGPGHYPATPLPGQRGTVAIAGHRTTYGAPFRNIDKLRRGDQIVARDALRPLHLPRRAHADRPADRDVWVTQRVGYDRLVLSACHPLYSAAKRIVVFARLVRAEAAGQPQRDDRVTTPSIDSASDDDLTHMTVLDSRYASRDRMTGPARDDGSRFGRDVRSDARLQDGAGDQVQAASRAHRARDLRRWTPRRSPRRSSSGSSRAGRPRGRRRAARAASADPRRARSPASRQRLAGRPPTDARRPSGRAPDPGQPDAGGRRSAAARRPGGTQTQQLVVLAAGRGELGGLAPERAATSATPGGERQRARRRARAARRSPRPAAARRTRGRRRGRASRVAPAAASARPSASRGRGRR